MSVPPCLAALCAVMLAFSAAVGAEQGPGARKRTPKPRRGPRLLTPEQIQTARENLRRHPWARRIRDGVLAHCKERFDLPPERLAALVPEKTPLVSSHCPKCRAHFAHMALEEFGDVGRCTGCGAKWRWDPTDKSEKWDIQGALRSHRLRYLYMDVADLGLAYLLTGEPIYAERVAAIIKRFARVYRRYRMSAIHKNIWLKGNHHYYGKIDGWKFRDGLCVSNMLAAYDYTRGSGAFTDDELAFIDDNLVRYAMDYFIESFGHKGLAGNPNFQDMGYSWKSIALAAVILRDEAVLRSLVQLFRHLCTGTKSTVFFPEDGAFYQRTHSYASQMLGPLMAIAEILRAYPDADVYRDPQCALLRKAITWPYAITYPNGVCAPSNDAHVGETWGIGYSQIAYHRYGGRKSLMRIRETFGADLSRGNIFALFNRPPGGFDTRDAEPYGIDSADLPGHGVAVVRHGSPRPRQTMALLDYGPFPKAHGQPDFLNIGLWANGMVMITEMGYQRGPVWLKHWQKSPMAHNTVLELAPHKATRSKATAWCITPQVKAVEGGLPGKTARRLLGLVPIDGNDCYLIDVFWAAVGKGTHTWRLHAASDQITTTGIGKTTSVKPPYVLRNARQATVDGPVSVTWSFSEGRALRTTLLGDGPTAITLAECPPEENVVHQAFTYGGARLKDKPFPYRAILLAERRQAVSCFAAVHEPCQGGRLLHSVERLPVERGEGIALQATFERGGATYRDVFVQAAPGSAASVVAAGVKLTGRAALVRLRRTADGEEPVFAVLMNGRTLQRGPINLRHPKPANACWTPTGHN